MKKNLEISKAIVVGLGNIALRHRQNLKLLFPEIFIIAVPASGKFCDQKIDFADQIILNLKEALKENVNIAIIASPATFHLKHAKLLLMAKVPTLIEKPVASNLKETRELIKIQKETNTPTSIGYCLRYMPSSIKIKKILKQNIIGNIYNAFVNVGQYLPDWRQSNDYLSSVSANKHLGGGVLLELSHEIDYIQWLLGSMQVQYAKLRNTNELKLEVEELADIVLYSDTKIICNLHLDFLQKTANRTCSFIGEKGRIDWDLLKNNIQLETKEGSKCLFSQEDWCPNQMYISTLRDFFKLAFGYKNTCVTLNEAVKTIELIETIKHYQFDRIKN